MYVQQWLNLIWSSLKGVQTRTPQYSCTDYNVKKTFKLFLMDRYGKQIIIFVPKDPKHLVFPNFVLKLYIFFKLCLIAYVK